MSEAGNKIKERFTCRDALSREGITLNGGGKILCPLPDHNDTDPSFQYHEIDDWFYCHGCKRGGDSIKLYALMKGINNEDAFKELAQELEITLSKQDPVEYARQQDEKAKNQEVYGNFLELCKEELAQNEEMQAFCVKQWGHDRDIQQKYHYGYCTPEIYDKLLKQYGSDRLKLAGLMGDGGWKVFSGRLVKPYLSPSAPDGMPIYFIGRDPAPDCKIKYVKALTKTDKNPRVSDTVKNPLYVIQATTDRDTVYITEGIGDSVSIHEATGASVVSPVTNKLNKADIITVARFVKRYKNIVLANDAEGNKSGEKGAISAIRELRGQGKPGTLHRLLIGANNFTESLLTVDDMRDLAFFHILSIFFDSIMPTKPIPAFLGEKGSGKTAFFKKLSIVLFGQGIHNIIRFSSILERDCETLATNNFYFCIDNAEEKSPFLNNFLAVCATGGEISQRALYTDNKEIRFKVSCHVGITSRDPRGFSRDDVADRMLPFRLDRLDEDHIIAESRFLEEVHESRDAIWGDLVQSLQDVLRALKEVEPFNSGIRMGDFGEFCMRIARFGGDAEEAGMKQTFERLKNEQAGFTLEHDPLFDWLNRWLEKPFNNGREVTARELHDDFKQMAEDNNIKFYYKDNFLAFAKKIKTTLECVKREMDVNISKGKCIKYMINTV